MTNKEIRRKIIEMVYERFKEHPYYRVTPKEFKDALSINLKDLHYNIIYLEEKGYIELQKPLEGEIFVGARITPRGIDLIEDEYEFNLMFQETETQTVDVAKEFSHMVEAIQQHEEISSDKKEVLTEALQDIQKELKKDVPSFATIKKVVRNIKKRNEEIYKKVVAILSSPEIARILNESARKELNTK